MQTVLVVEPYAALRITIGEILEGSGYGTLLARSTDEAVLMAGRAGLHAALVAVDLYENDGKEGLRVVRQLLTACPSAIVIVTAPHQPIQELAQLVRHLEKPFSKAALERALVSTLH